MPRAVFKSVREVSSEDDNFKAVNLLLELPNKPWKTKTAGENQAYVILELAESQRIVGIDIGNAHSAFVEVLVGKTACTRDDFKEILITCSFMTPMESRNSDNPNRVRCFGAEALVDTVAKENWQMVKIICTQPFNKHVTYGLSFIKLHVEETQSSKVNKLVVGKLTPKVEKRIVKIGAFSLRPSSSDSDSETTDGLFQRWKIKSKTESKENGELNQSMQEKPNQINVSQCETLPKYKEKTNGPLPTDDVPSTSKASLANRKSVNEGSNKRLFSPSSGKEVEAKKHREFENIKEKTNGRLPTDDVPSTSKASLANRKSVNEGSNKRLFSPSSGKEVEAKKTRELKDKEESTNGRLATDDVPSTSKFSLGSKKRLSSPSGVREVEVSAKKAKTNAIAYRPFDKLLSGVVLVISGIQNPDRADLRSKALAMGAKYRVDWDPGCTHLICAFKNTPKYNQVKGKGKIIKRTWIEECYAAKKYLPWRRFALDTADADMPESDVEVWQETLESVEEKKSPLKEDFEMQGNPTIDLSSGTDTEDELERVKQSIENNKLTKSSNENGTKKKKSVESDDYDNSTEEEDYLKEKMKEMKTNDKSLNFFDKTKFFLCNDNNVVSCIKLQNYIEKYGGSVTEDLREANYALTNYGLTDPSDAVGFNGIAVQPRWVYECHDLETKVPTQRYLI